uniref:Ig-like domain-containing protein n=1 Tax=Sinocyclocheilus grahami TaxID=75366 RepID=A0A672P192_SINGR
LLLSEVLIYFNCSSDSAGQVTVIQTPTEKHVQNGQTVTLTCKTSSSNGRQSDGWCKSCFSWYLQKPGETPKRLVHSIKTLHTGTPSRFSGSGADTDFSLTISGVQTEDTGHYYCQSFHEINSKYVFTQVTVTALIQLRDTAASLHSYTLHAHRNSKVHSKIEPTGNVDVVQYCFCLQ